MTDIPAECGNCGVIANPKSACDRDPDGKWLCAECFDKTPCGRGEHGEGCATDLWDDDVTATPSFIEVDTPKPARPDDFHSSDAGHSVQDAESLERAKRRAMFPPNRKGKRAFIAAEARRGR